MIVVFITMIIGILLGLFESVNLFIYERFWIPDKWISAKRFTASWGVVVGLMMIFMAFMCMGIYTFMDKGMLN